MITSDLVRNNYCIVSGLALGVDSVAHATTVENKGRTIAVLGCGVDCCNPGSNYALYNSILNSGSCVISEFPLSQPPTTGSFPSRNRIIAGISQAIVVTEGALDSGALITAQNSIEDRRTIFAVPGPIISQLSKGPNDLLKKGAKLVTGGEDIIKELGHKDEAISNKKKEIKGETKEEQKIINLLKDDISTFDEILHKGAFDTAKLSTLLSLMELKGFIKLSERGEYFLT